MANFCVPKQFVEKFLDGLRSGEVDPFKLSSMSSDERRSLLEKYVGKKSAQQTNALFESKLLLKNQKQGFANWARKVGGLTPQTRTDIISRINKLDKVFNPEEEQAFLKDLASTKLGTDVTMEESKRIFSLSQKAQDAKQRMTENPNDIKARIDYGNAKLDTLDYINELNPKKANIVTNIANLPRSLVASLDFVSAPFRHGWGMSTRANFWKNYVNMPKYAFSEKAFRNKMADIVSRDTYPLMQKGKLRITNFSSDLTKREEQFMSSILDKFPITRGSSRAYMGFLNGLRADMFDQFLRSAQLRGEDVSANSKTIKDLANVVNNFTGGSNLPLNLEKIDPILNTVIFSPRKLVATIQMLNPNTYLNPSISKTARQEALRNILGSAGASAGLLVLAHMAGASIETDPRSSDFGQIRVGNTRFDVTGGNRTYATLISRLITGQTKSTTSKAITNLGTGYKPTTRADVTISYARNKLSPTASFFADWLWGADTLGNPFNITKELAQRIIPMNITDGMELMNGDQGNSAMGIMLSLFGVPVSAYSGTKQDWSTSTSKAVQSFQNKVSPQQFQQANQEYNTQLEQKTNKLTQDPRYQNLSDTQKQTVLKKLKAKVQKQVFKGYNYTYHPKKKKSTNNYNQLVQ